MKMFFSVLLIIMLWGSTAGAVVYISPIDGTGTDANPFRSRCLGLTGAGNIDLRPWGFNRFLCRSNALPANMTGVQQLGDEILDNLTPARKSALETLIGRPLTGLTVREVIIEILEARLRVGKDGKKKIFLGGQVPIYEQTAWIPFRDNGLVADVTNAALGLIEPVKAWAASIGETFTATDGDLEGCQARGCTHDWDEFLGTGFTIASNAASVSGAAGSNEAFATTALATIDQTASVTITSIANGGTTTACGPIVRKANNTTRTYFSAVAQINNAGELSSFQLTKRVAGTLTTLGTDTTDISTPVVVGVTADGDQISLQVGGSTTFGPTTDAEDMTGNLYTGLRQGIVTNNAGSTCVMDNFSAEDIVDAASSGGHLKRRHG